MASLTTETRIIPVINYSTITAGQAAALRSFWASLTGDVRSRLNFQMREAARLTWRSEPTPGLALGFVWAAIDAGWIAQSAWDAFAASVRWAAL